ncbi:Endonuclease III [Chitinispirillum alkaliphilum]|nr:Endonuclease III [Chitinispirillum alkaliphilum]
MNLYDNVKIDTVYHILEKEFRKHRMPVVDLIEAQTNDPFKVLITTIMSARTRDETTTTAALRLFQHVTSPEDLKSISQSELEKLIYPVGFYKEKAKHLKKLPEVLDSLFQGSIPHTVDELVKLPGVGRKTANLVVAVAFNKPAVCVDIHVHRIFNRLGYLQSKTPHETEMKLRTHFPEKYWVTFNSYFVSFGQNTCTPINPKCPRCPIAIYCSKVGVKKNSK